ncbi:MAG TPA: hypothetical protein VFR67_17100 [Pilimelia sp.]|nr:hypothetical protein [Pilimelia sp.]
MSRLSEAPRWVLVVLALAALVGLIAFARGVAHHRGQQVGAAAAGVVATAPAVLPG